jgi:hypothetical protein
MGQGPGGGSFAIKGGITSGTLGSPLGSAVSYNSDNIVGFAGGIGLGFPAAPSASLDIDVLYVRKGGRTQGTLVKEGQEYPMTSDYLLQYVVLAPMIRAFPARVGPRPYLLVGGEVGILVKATRDSRAPQAGEQYVSDMKRDFRQYDYAVTAGLGVEFPMGGNSYFFTEGRYAFGLSRVDEENGMAPNESYTRTIYVMGGFRF